MMLAAVIMAFGMSACGSDDDNSGSGSNSDLVGSWYQYDDETGLYEIMTFSSDWQFTITILGQKKDGTWLKYSVVSQYQVNGNTLTTIINGTRATGTFSRSGNTLIIDGERYTLVSGSLLENLNKATPCDSSWNPL